MIIKPFVDCMVVFISVKFLILSFLLKNRDLISTYRNNNLAYLSTLFGEEMGFGNIM